MSHIKGYVQFISEQNQDQTELEKNIAAIRNLIRIAKEKGLTRGEERYQKKLDKLLQTKKSNNIIGKETAPKVAPVTNGDKSNTNTAAEPAAKPVVSLADTYGGDNPGAEANWTDEQKDARERAKRAVVNTDPKPAVVNTDPKPAVVNTDPKPAVVNTAKPAVVNTDPKPAVVNTAKPAVVNTAKPAVVNTAKPVAKKQEPFQMSSGRGNEALRARNIAKAKARKQNPTVNTKPTLNKAGTGSGSGVDALRQRINKRAEERGK